MDPQAGLFGMGQPHHYSIKDEFNGATVLITGASGYIGSLVLERLLRTTNVRTVYVLMRGKRGVSADERLRRLLYSGLFHLVRDDARLLSKVHALEGDMSSEDLGLSESDKRAAQAGVHIVVHCAASIELEADVQSTLQNNYLGTCRLLALAQGMRALRAFVHVSTAFVNINAPTHSTVDERFYPLRMGSDEMAPEAVVDDLMGCDPDIASVRAQMYLDMWNFPNTYTLGKHLTEKMVARHYRDGMPIAIVRPALVAGLSGAPYPGYCGNLAGPIGIGIALAVGLFDRIESVAIVPTHVWDAVPGDLVGSAIIATAAVVSAGLAADLDYFAPHKQQQQQQQQQGAGAASGGFFNNNGGGSHDQASASGSGGFGGGNGNGNGGAMPRAPMIVHACTSTTYPITFAETQWTAHEFIRENPPPFCLPGARLFKLPLDFRPDPAAVERAKWWTGWKVFAACKVLQLLGQHKTARRLKYGHLAWAIQNSAKTDTNIKFGTHNLQALEAQLDPSERADYMLTWTRARGGGWQRFAFTNFAGLYRQVFGVGEIRNIEHDFVFRPAVEPPPRTDGDPDEDAVSIPSEERDVFEAGHHVLAASMATMPADGNEHALPSHHHRAPPSSPAQALRRRSLTLPGGAEGAPLRSSMEVPPSSSGRERGVSDTGSGYGSERDRDRGGGSATERDATGLRKSVAISLAKQFAQHPRGGLAGPNGSGSLSSSLK